MRTVLWAPVLSARQPSNYISLGRTAEPSAPATPRKELFTMADIIIGLIIAAVCVAIIARGIHNRRQGKHSCSSSCGSCGCGCGGCASSGTCHTGQTFSK